MKRWIDAKKHTHNHIDRVIPSFQKVGEAKKLTLLTLLSFSIINIVEQYLGPLTEQEFSSGV